MWRPPIPTSHLAARGLLPALLLFAAAGLWAQPAPEEAQRNFPSPPSEFDADLGAPHDEGSLRTRRLTFPSAFQTPWEANNTVRGILMTPLPEEEPLPLVIILHGLGVRDHYLEERLGKRLNERGIAVLLLTLPYHIERTPPGYRSGALALRPDVESFRANFRQAVSDVRRAIDWAERYERVDSRRVGVMGVSLGAIVASLAMSVDERILYGTLLLGGGDVAHILWHSSLTISVRETMRRQGWTEERLRAELADIEPLNYATPEMGERVFLIGGLFDTVVPEEDTAKLHRALGSPPMLWLETGHYGAILVERRLFGLAAEFFDARFAGREFVPPASIHAPTIRFGLTLDAERGVQVAAGVDLWRSNRRGEFYAAGLLTTRGLSLFAGWRGPLGFSPGLFALPDKTAPGLLWHFVL